MPAKQGEGRRTAEAGFSLLEAIIALAIVAAAAGLAFEVFAANLRESERRRFEVAALPLAHLRLSEVRDMPGVMPGTEEGVTREGLHWRREIELVHLSVSGARIAEGAALYRVTVLIRRNGSDGHVVRLVTIVRGADADGA